MVQEEDTPPELIPPQAFQLDTELFKQRRSGTATIDPNFMAAVMRVWPISTHLEPHLVMPAILTRAALDTKPHVQGGAWVWAGTARVYGRPVAYTLTGRPTGSEVDWTLEVNGGTSTRVDTAPTGTSARVDSAGGAGIDSVQAGLDGRDQPIPVASGDTTATDAVPAPDSVGPAPSGGAASPPEAVAKSDRSLVLYTAQTARDGRHGRWQLFDRVDGERQNILNGAFEIEKNTKFEVTLAVPPGAPEHGGDSVVYAQDGEEHRLRWVRQQSGQTYHVRWNVQSHAGAITASNYNDGTPACWGTQLDDVTCSQ